MKGAMEHAGSTCCCTEEHRWPLLVEAVEWHVDNTAAFYLHIIIKFKEIQSKNLAVNADLGNSEIVTEIMNYMCVKQNVRENQHSGAILWLR